MVSDAGPLILLAQINKLHLLEKLPKQVIITPKVKSEAVDEGWIIVEGTSKPLASAVKRLAEDEGVSRADAEKLMFAREKDAEVLVDEKALSNLARMFGLRAWSTWTLLLRGLSRGFIEASDVEAAIRELGEERHKLKRGQVDQILEAAKLIACRREREETGSKI